MAKTKSGSSRESETPALGGGFASRWARIPLGAPLRDVGDDVLYYTGARSPPPRPVLENPLDRQAEQPRHSEGQRQAWVALARLDGVDRLARDLQALGQVGLGPFAFGAQDAQAVFHRIRNLVGRVFDPTSARRADLPIDQWGCSTRFSDLLARLRRRMSPTGEL
jgi:hypothetical protein